MNITTERRARTERRHIDAGPPRGSSERRRSAERRLPAAVDCTISDADWEKYFGGSTKAANTNDFMLDQASEVFDRVRDSY